MTDGKHVHTILYAEDDPDDLFMVRQAFARFDGAVTLLHAVDGFHTIQMLNEAKENSALPCLIVLDVNMPGMDGKETLIRIKEDPQLNKIPAVLFTTSSSDVDRSFAVKWNAEFITKPLVYSELETLVNTLMSLCSTKVAQKT